MNIDFNELEKSLQSIYQKNLNFLKENFFDIYNNIENLSKSILHNNYKEKYSLELCDGYFDIKNLENNGFYYSTNSYADAEKRAEIVDYTKNSSYNLLRTNPKNGKLSFPLDLKDIVPIVDFINKEIDLDNIEFLEIKKFIYIGVGLGLHLSEIDKKIKSYTTMIIEPELEIFRLSLFTVDYTEFKEGNRELFLSVGKDKNQRYNTLASFYKHHEYMNYNIKSYKLLENFDYIHDEITDFFTNNFMLAFPYSKVIMNLERTLSHVREKDRFLDLKKIVPTDIFKNKRVLMISAGPSLDNYIDIIKENQDKFVVVCVDVILRKLEKNGIVPDIVFSIDPSPMCANYLKTSDPNYLKNSVIILMTQQDKSTMKIIRDRELNFYCSQFATIFEELGYLGTAENVGTFSFLVMIRLKAKELYLIGNDAAFDQITGNRYSKDSSYIQMENLEENIINKDNISLDDIISVKGNLQDYVKTNRSLLNFKDTYDVTIKELSPYYEYEAYNLSDGVFVDGLTPLSPELFLEKVKLFDINNMNTIEKMNEISTVVDGYNFEDDSKKISLIISRTKKFQKIKIKSKDDFLGNKLDHMIWILSITKTMKMDMISKIFLQYTEVVDTYINFVLNLKQNDLHNKKNIDFLSLKWSNGIISIFKEIKNKIK